MRKLFLIVPMMAFLVGCSSSVPACGDEEATDIVKEIVGDVMAEQLGSDAAKLFSYSVNSIITTDENEKTGAFQCSADLEIHASNTGQSNELPITYTVEITDDGAEIYVNVYGL